MIRIVGASVLVLLAACAHHRLDEDSGPRDARLDARPDDVGPLDAGAPDVFVPPPEPPTCVGQPETPSSGGRIRGSVPIGDFDFAFVTADIDFGFCNTLFFRAGANALLEGDGLELEVGYPRDGRELGERGATLTIWIGEERWREEVVVDIERADGLFDMSVPYDERATSLHISHHDATSDIEGDARNVRYTCTFRYCAI